MIIHIPKISPDGSSYTGELPPESLDLKEDKFIQAKSPVRYSLNAEIVSDQVIVRGTVETELHLLCVVCAEFFSTTVRISSFLRTYAIQPGLETIDLTEDLREELLLQVPHYPRGDLDENECCKQCGRNLKNEATSPPPEHPPDAWNALNDLELEE